MPLVNPLRYDTARDAEMRLSRSVVRWRGRAFYVQQCHGDLTCSGILLDTLQPLNRIHTSDEDIDISSVPLGYLNWRKAAFYISRMPRRRNKQGFCEGTAFIIAEDKDIQYTASGLIYTKEFSDLMQGIYPGAIEAIGMLENKEMEVKSIGITRKLAFVKDRLGIIKLHHMGRPVGYLTDSGRIKMPEEFKSEYFEKSLHKAGFRL